VIAAVNGLAYGGGCELVEACHLAIAASTATFAKPEIRLGFPPSWRGTQRLPRLVGRKRALAMILTAETIDANTAAAIGLVNEVVADEELVPAVRRWIDRILPHGSAAVAACLTAVTRGAELPVDQALSVEASEFLRVAGRRDTVEAVQRFRIR
jgi:enoyl-CoA hydratase/carnithine racemase